MIKTAILVDGGFYRRRAQAVNGDKSAVMRADELATYCKRHVHTHGEDNYLYRIFYYDCLPTDKRVYHPFLKKQIDLGKSDLYIWTNEFFSELKKRRKFALRLGKLARREGIDFILDPLGAHIKSDLFEHIDGLRTCDKKYLSNEK